MAEEKKEKWLNYLSVTTVLIAVFATLSTFKGGGYSTKSVLSQSKASDQWAYFQSKSIKSYLCEMQKENLELELNNPTQNKEAIQKKIDFYTEKIKKYAAEKDQISAEAKEYELARDESKSHSERFGIAVIFLQVSILLSSISALTKKKPIWLVGLVIGIVGFAYFLNGFFVYF